MVEDVAGFAGCKPRIDPADHFAEPHCDAKLPEKSAPSCSSQSRLIVAPYWSEPGDDAGYRQCDDIARALGFRTTSETSSPKVHAVEPMRGARGVAAFTAHAGAKRCHAHIDITETDRGSRFEAACRGGFGVIG